MAGLLERFANWAEPVLSASYHTRRAAKQDEAEREQRLQGLLGQFGGSQVNSAPPGMGATSAPQAGLMSQGGFLPPQFYQQAGMIPGMEGFLAQDQAGGQRMELQQQDQQHRLTNVDLVDQQRMAQDQKQYESVSGNQAASIAAQKELAYASLAQQAADAERAFGGMSAYQQAMLKQRADELAAAGAAGPAAPSGYTRVNGVLQAEPGGKAYEEQMRITTPLDLAMETVERGLQFAKKKGSYETGKDSYKISQDIKNDTINAVQALRQAGALGKEEQIGLEKMGWDFNDLENWNTMDSTAVAQLEALRDFIGRNRDKIYAAQNRPAPKPWGKQALYDKGPP